MVRKLLFNIYAVAWFMLFGANLYGLHVYAIPASNRTGCGSDYIQSIYGHDAAVIQVPVPKFPVDLGQDVSQWSLDKKFKEQNQPGIVHAVCGGTATALLHVVHNPKNAVTGLVLEGVLGSANAAIQFRATNADLAKEPLFPNKPLISRFAATFANTSFGKYVYPHLLLPAGYCAFKESPLEAVSRLENKELPIVIVEQHAGDHAVPPTQSRALYYVLRKHAFRNAYLIQPDNAAHVDLIDPRGEKAAAICRIMQQSATPGDRALYQPDHLQFESDYTKLIQHDRQVRSVAKVTTAAMLCGLFYFAARLRA